MQKWQAFCGTCGGMLWEHIDGWSEARQDIVFKTWLDGQLAKGNIVLHDPGYVRWDHRGCACPYEVRQPRVEAVQAVRRGVVAA